MPRLVVILTILLFCSGIHSNAQAPPVIHWQKRFGGSGSEAGEVVRATPDGGYILGGSTTSNDRDLRRV